MCRKGAKLELTVGVTLVKLFRMQAHGFFYLSVLFKRGEGQVSEKYQALYRKWRPMTFDDVVGQNHITETLKHELASEKNWACLLVLRH